MTLKKGKRKVAEGLAKYVLRTGRGSGLISQVTDMGRDILEGTVYLFAIKGLLGIVISPLWLPVIVIIKKIAEYTLGWLDERVGFWKFENEYITRNINPFNAELMERVKRIESHMKRKER